MESSFLLRRAQAFLTRKKLAVGEKAKNSVWIVPRVRRVRSGYLAAVFWIYAYCNEIATYIPKFRSHAICITGILMGIKRCIHFVHI